MTNKEKDQMDSVERQQYKNLRKCFYDILLDPIMGKDYYNMGMDVYQSDRYCCIDLKKKFDDLEFDMRMWRKIAIVAILLCIVLLVFR